MIRGGMQGSSAVAFLVVGAPNLRNQVDQALGSLMQSVRITAPKA